MEQLRELMSKLNAKSEKDEIARVFKQIAEIIETKLVINDNDVKYRIIDFEFYFYNQYHQDISVHPRKSEALCWYINDFGGIDLNFKSEISISKSNPFKYKLNGNSYFGGILIRQIQRLYSDDKFVFDGPLKVATLFRFLDATSRMQNNPILEIQELDKADFNSEKRHNLLGSHKDNPKAKAEYNVKECFANISEIDIEDLGEKLRTFNEAEYRYRYRCPSLAKK